MFKNIWVLAIFEAITIFVLLLFMKNIFNNPLGFDFIIAVSIGVPILHLFWNWTSKTKLKKIN